MDQNSCKSFLTELPDPMAIVFLLYWSLIFTWYIVTCYCIVRVLQIPFWLYINLKTLIVVTRMRVWFVHTNVLVWPNFVNFFHVVLHFGAFPYMGLWSGIVKFGPQCRSNSKCIHFSLNNLSNNLGRLPISFSYPAVSINVKKCTVSYQFKFTFRMRSMNRLFQWIHLSK